MFSIPSFAYFNMFCISRWGVDGHRSEGRTHKADNSSTASFDEEVFTILDALSLFGTPSSNPQTPRNQSNAPQVPVDGQLSRKPDSPVVEKAYLMDKGSDASEISKVEKRGKSFSLAAEGRGGREEKQRVRGEWRVQRTPCSVTCGQGEGWSFVNLVVGRYFLILLIVQVDLMQK